MGKKIMNCCKDLIKLKQKKTVFYRVLFGSVQNHSLKICTVPDLCDLSTDFIQEMQIIMIETGNMKSETVSKLNFCFQKNDQKTEEMSFEL